MEHTKNIKPVLLVFALSNMAALIYQISWTKSLSYVFGTSVYAVGTVLACFMAGLALGSFVLGKKVDRSQNPLRLFAYVEIALGLFALFLIPVFAFLPQPYASLHGLFEGSAVLNFLLFALSFQVLIIPTSLIGGTFPIMNRIYSRQIKTIGEDVGIVYSVDTIFAAIGALSAGFFLLPVIGISKAVALGAVINILAGLYLYKKSCKTEWIAHVENGDADENRNKRIKPVNSELDRTELVVFASFFLSGFAALAIEVVWIRFLSLTLGTS
ncbi:MAG: fused MFS/spermidine synthase, partial [Candidatus Methanoperedens sp.]|nr:fused MFS/spermidine synthase [Candidatus Methanoperedens sp.]